jgi:hypothetical protein
MWEPPSPERAESKPSPMIVLIALIVASVIAGAVVNGLWWLGTGSVLELRSSLAAGAGATLLKAWIGSTK